MKKLLRTFADRLVNDIKGNPALGTKENPFNEQELLDALAELTPDQFARLVAIAFEVNKKVGQFTSGGWNHDSDN